MGEVVQVEESTLPGLYPHTFVLSNRNHFYFNYFWSIIFVGLQLNFIFMLSFALVTTHIKYKIQKIIICDSNSIVEASSANDELNEEDKSGNSEKKQAYLSHTK